ncbi:hypothetical protein RGQ15_18320 [Paracoccus sp. MBLB3053]|uniref:Solute-binding protein family 3/N-terminal domain-containing protein n=1 Tax=Paracoccus aurantius TaxID=3073814 RepID=A0ABU2HWT5_9RHOB|nr:hypothetical protein [Paracoccus sp. MBLB3053]MDS9469525.1 hypothetical protein [Paracoccus sp. MBLB3053]
MLPPVQLTEGWLRVRAYQAVGIPVRLEQTMRNLIVTLERASAGDETIGKGHLTGRLKQYRDQWARTIDGHAWAQRLASQRETRNDELLSLLAQLELMVAWAKRARGSWPGHEVSQAVREREREFVADTEKLLNEFQQRMAETPEEATGENIAARMARFNEYLASVMQRAESLRYDLVGILAIFLERDLDSPDTEPVGRTRHAPEPSYTDPALRELLLSTERPDSAGSGPEAGMFFAMIAVFVLCTAAAWRGLQEPIGQFVEQTNLFGLLISALVETLRIASLTWLPLLAAFSLRQVLWDNGDWARARRTKRPLSYVPQLLTCLCLAIAVSLIGLTGVAALKAFFIAQNPEYFASLLMGGAVPFLLYYPTQAILLVALVPLALVSADLRSSSRYRLLLGLLCAVLTGALSLCHTLYWSTYLINDCLSATQFFADSCRRRMDLIGHLVIMVLAFLAAGVFGELPERTRLSRPRSLAASALIFAMIWPIPQARAQEPATEVVTVRIGFRTDIEPFSYQNRDPFGDRPFRGYLADMCFDLFAGSPGYRVEVVPVSAETRFSAFNSHEIDMLCDAVTMRFSDQLRSTDGVYSPIVFASGVSFLDLASRAVGGVSLGFVLNSTARDVALKACQIDFFKAMMPDQKSALIERCNLRWRAAILHARLERALALSGHGDPDWPIEAERVRSDLSRFLEAARRLDKIRSDLEITRIAPETLALIDLKDGDMVATCDSNLRHLTAQPTAACEAALEKLGDGVCRTSYSPPPRDPNALRVPIEQSPWPDYHFCPMNDHGELIEWLCISDSSLRRVYLGDRELILGKLESWVGSNGSCKVERSKGAEYLTYEPYAFLIRVDEPELIQFVQRRVFELFSDRAAMTARFQTSFPGRAMSTALAYLFLLNAVENESLFQPRAASHASAGLEFEGTVPRTP